MIMETPELKEARIYAAGFGWTEICHQENIHMVSFVKDGARLNYYYSRCTVGTVVDHPRHGRNQMFRKSEVQNHGHKSGNPKQGNNFKNT